MGRDSRGGEGEEEGEEVGQHGCCLLQNQLPPPGQSFGVLYTMEQKCGVEKLRDDDRDL